MFNIFSINKANTYIPNQRPNNYLGEVFSVTTEIKNGMGKIRTNDDILWRVKGEDCSVGTKVKLIKVIDSDTFDVLIVKE